MVDKIILTSIMDNTMVQSYLSRAVIEHYRNIDKMIMDSIPRWLHTSITINFSETPINMEYAFPYRRILKLMGYELKWYNGIKNLNMIERSRNTIDRVELWHKGGKISECNLQLIS